LNPGIMAIRILRDTLVYRIINISVIPQDRRITISPDTYASISNWSEEADTADHHKGTFCLYILYGYKHQ
jgi:hypothetical protein